MADWKKSMSWGTGILILGVTFVLAFQSKKENENTRSNLIHLNLHRFFGSCTDEFSAVTDVSQAVGECGVIQVLTNKFNQENGAGVRVNTETTEWSAYYNHLSAAYATKHPPDIAILHRSVLPNFVKRGLVIPLKDKLLDAEVDLNDLVPAAKEGVTLNEDIYALPFDFHALLWHLNLDLLREAQLTDKKGDPILPASPEELYSFADQLKKATGKHYFTIPSQTDPMPTWLFESWVWQQGGNLFSRDLHLAIINSETAQNALQVLNTLYLKGHADASQDYMGAEQAFLNGEAAVLLNGTWVVDSYISQAKKPKVRLKNYRAVSIPQLFKSEAAWTDSHVWVIPSKVHPDPKKIQAAVLFLKFLFLHNSAWAKTGHLPVRKSVLNSIEFQSLPNRKFYMNTATIAHSFPFIENQQSIHDILIQQINSTWLTPRVPSDSLSEAQKLVQKVLDEARSN